MNLIGIRLYTLKINISSLNIKDFIIINTTKYSLLLEVFGYQTTNLEANNYFDATDKAFIIFCTKKLNVTSTYILYIYITAYISLF